MNVHCCIKQRRKGEHNKYLMSLLERRSYIACEFLNVNKIRNAENASIKKLGIRNDFGSRVDYRFFDVFPKPLQVCSDTVS
jgi:hypothetical protein